MVLNVSEKGPNIHIVKCHLQNRAVNQLIVKTTLASRVNMKCAVDKFVSVLVLKQNFWSLEPQPGDFRRPKTTRFLFEPLIYSVGSIVLRRG